MRRARALAVATAITLVAVLVATACGDDSSSSGGGGSPVTVTVVTHDSFAVSKPVLTRFERESGITVKVLKSGDAGAALNQVILTKDHPLGDVFFGVDNTLLSRAEDADVFTPSDPAALASVPATLRLDPKRRLIPIDYGDVCVNDDVGYFEQRNEPAPSTLEDLADRRYRDLLVVENPATSSPGLAFLLATVAKFGPDGYLDYWRRLRQNGVRVVDGWDEAYTVEFSGSSGHGSRPLVVSYGSSPPAEVLSADPAPSRAPTGVLTDTCFRQIEFAGVLRGTAHPREAAAVVDFLLSPAFQADLPLQMFVYPAVSGTPLPAEFSKWAVIPKAPLTIAPGQIARHRDEWIDAWTETVLG